MKKIRQNYSDRETGTIKTMAFFLLFCLQISSLPAQIIPSPSEHFGFNIGDDYTLATYTQTEAYFKKLAASGRTSLVDIGMTEEGRHQYMLIVSSPGNISNLQHYKEISQRLARAEGITEEEARALSVEGKAVVWIDGGLHSTEVVGTHQLIETAWQLISRNDSETLRILENVIVLLVNANPDGQELVSSWYMNESDPKKRKTNIPRLYQKYAGHDNNRDFYMLSLKESRNMSTQLYIEWMPQILYNHHQSGPAGTVLAGPPYRDPFNYLYDPLLVTGIDALGAAMNNRLNAEGRPGYTMRAGASFSTWYNGGLRTTAYYHNIIGLLTEIIGSPTPGEVPFVPDRLIPNGSNPNPVTPGEWHFRQSIDYSVSLNYAVLDYASRHRDEILYNIYRMGSNSIEKGSRDNWTVSPKSIEAVRNAVKRDSGSATGRSGGPGQGASRIPVKYFDEVLRNPSSRDARAYIIPSDQADFPTAGRFVNALIGSGIRVKKAASPFIVNGKSYPSGSYVIETDQSFRPHIIDMFEPQDHPNDLQYPGGPPVPPYDAAGWTLSFQMGIKFDRLLEKPEGTFQVIPYGELQKYSIEQVLPNARAGFVLSPKINNSFTVVNDLIMNGVKVYRLPGGSGKPGDAEPGSFYIPVSGVSIQLLASAASEHGVKVSALSRKPSTPEMVVPLHIAVWNRYGGSMSSGWLSWILEQFRFPYNSVYSQEIDSGNLRMKYDVIIFPSGAIPAVRRTSDTIPQQQRQSVLEDIPKDYRKWTGNITADKSVPQLKKFMEEGGTVICLGSSTNLAYHLGLPVKSALVKTGKDGRESALRSTEYYIPGSLISADIDTLERANWGMSSKADVYFDQSPVFRFEQEAAQRGMGRLMWFSEESPLHSGWALGQKHLKDGIAAFVAPVGKGKLYAFGPDITFRSQPHGTFKLLFNQLYALVK